MRIVLLNILHEIKFNFGLKGYWIGKVINLGISLLTASIMGLVYAFNEETREIIGVENVIVYLLSGFLMQFLVLSSTSITPSRILMEFQFESFEYAIFCSVNVVKYVLGIYLGLFITDFILSLPFFIIISIIVSPILSLQSFIAFVGFILVSSFLLFSVAFLFSSFYAISKNYRGYQAFIATIISYICGVYFPVQGYFNLLGSVGGWIGISIISFFPQTFVFDIARKIIFAGDYITIFPIWLEILFLFISTIVLGFLAHYLFKIGIKKWRRKGFKSYIY